MMCFRCGHAQVDHYDEYFPIKEHRVGCNTCFFHRANKSRFFTHKFEGNLEYLERKAEEKRNELSDRN